MVFCFSFPGPSASRSLSTHRKKVPMDHNCPVCKSDLKWQLPAAKIKRVGWKFEYQKKCDICGSVSGFNRHINENMVNQYFIILSVLFIVQYILEHFQVSKTLDIIFFVLQFLVIMIGIIKSYIWYKRIPNDWPRWRVIENLSCNKENG